MAGTASNPGRHSVARFLEGIEDDAVRVDCLALIEIMRMVSGCGPAMFGGSLVGFGSGLLAFDGARTGVIPLIGFSPRKRGIALFLRSGFESVAPDLARLGPHDTEPGCVSFPSLRDLDMRVLKNILSKAFQDAMERSAFSRTATSRAA